MKLANKMLFVVLLFSIPMLHAQSWHKVTAPSSARDFNSLAIQSRTSVFIAGGHENDYQSIFYSNNFGLTWDSLINTSGSVLTSIAFRDSLNGVAVGFDGTIIKSVDAGYHWTIITSPDTADFSKVIYTGANTLIAVGGNKGSNTNQIIIGSSDGGDNWNIVWNQTGSRLKSVCFSDSLNGITVGDSAVILKTIDGGNSWAPITAPVQRDLNAVAFTDSLNGFIVGGKEANDSARTILKTIDGGNNWTVVLNVSGAWLTAITFSTAGNGYIVGDKAAYYTTFDAGQNWGLHPVNGATGNEYFTDVNFFDPGFGVIAGKNGDVFVYTTTSLPELISGGATHINATQVRADVVINTHTAPAQYYIDFSTDSTLTSFTSTPVQNVTTSQFVILNTLLTGLTPNKFYYYRVVLQSIFGTQYSDTLRFYTYNYYLQTGAANNILYTSAQVHGTLNHITLTERPMFIYGLTPDLQYTASDSTSPAVISDTLMHGVAGNLFNLMADTTYYYTLAISTPNGFITGDTLSFHTLSGVFFTGLKTLPATNITDTSAQLNGFVNNVLLDATNNFEYDTTYNFWGTAYGYSITDTLPHNLVANAHPLVPNHLYYYRAVLTTGNRKYYGDTLKFFAATFTANTLPATNVSQTAAQLNGLVDKLYGNPDTLWFEYGSAPGLLNQVVDATPYIITDNLPHPVSALLTGLQPNTFYYFRLAGITDTLGSFTGAVKSFYTGNNPIPNWDFQYWSNDTFPLLDRWNIAGNGYQRVPGHSGNYALKVSGATFAVLGIFNEDMDNGINDGLVHGVPVHARPDSVSAYLNYSIAPNDSGTFGILLYSGNTVVAKNYYYLTGNTGGVFSKRTFPISYLSGLMPDSVVFVFIAANANNDNVIFNTVNFVTIDDISFSPAAPPVYNGDMEHWFDYPDKTLLSWSYFNHTAVDPLYIADTNMVSQVLFNTPADYAVMVRSVYFNGDWMKARIETSEYSIGDYLSGFPVHARYQTLYGYYKAFPTLGDTMSISLNMYSAGHLLSQSQLTITQTVADFTLFEIPVFYTDSFTIPDTAVIDISTYQAHQYGQSTLIVDKLSFDGFSVATNVPLIAHATDRDGINIYPNPAKNKLMVELVEPAEQNGFVQLFALDGRLVKQIAIPDGTKGLLMDLTDVTGGFYLVRYIEGNRVFNKKVVIEK